MNFYLNIIQILSFVSLISSNVYLESNIDTPLIIKPIIYHLKLQNECHYVGLSYNLNNCYSLHKQGIFNEWTKVNKPISIQQVWTDGSKFMENQITLQLLHKYGKEKVKGGNYKNVKQINKIFSNKYKIGDDVLIPRQYCPFLEIQEIYVNHLYYVIAKVIDIDKYLLTYQYEIKKNINSTTYYTDRIPIRNLFNSNNFELDKIMKFRKSKWVQFIVQKFKNKQNIKNKITKINNTWFCKIQSKISVIKLTEIKYDKQLSFSGIIEGGKCMEEMEKVAILYKIYNQDFNIYNEKTENKDLFWQLLTLPF